MVHEACVQNPGVSLSKLEEICDRVEEDESLSEPYKEKVIAAMKRYDSLSDDDKAGLDYAVCSTAYEKRKAGYKKYPDLAAMSIMEKIDMLNDDNYQQNIAEATRQYRAYQDDYEKNQIDEKYEEKIEKRTEKLEERGAGDLAEFFASREAYDKYKQPENIAEQNNAAEQKNVNTAMLLSLNAGNGR